MMFIAMHAVYATNGYVDYCSIVYITGDRRADSISAVCTGSKRLHGNVRRRPRFVHVEMRQQLSRTTHNLHCIHTLLSKELHRKLL